MYVQVYLQGDWIPETCAVQILVSEHFMQVRLVCGTVSDGNLNKNTNWSESSFHKHLFKRFLNSNSNREHFTILRSY